MTWRKPELIQHNVKELLQQINANADSLVDLCTPFLDYSGWEGRYDPWCERLILCADFYFFVR